MSDEYDDDTESGAEYTEADLLTASHLAALQERLRGERALVAFAAAHNLPASAVLKALGGSGAGVPVVTAPTDPPIVDADDDTDDWQDDGVVDRVSKAAALPNDGHTPAEVLDAALAVAQRAIAEGIDPEDALHALYELSFGDTVQKASGWDSAKHPRGDDGRFVKVSDIKAAKKDPEKAKALRARVTNPEERKKLDHALHSDEVSGSTRDIERHHARQQREKVQASRAVGRELRIKLADQESRGEELNPDDLRAVIPHLSQMTHEELGRMRAMLARSGATFGGKRLRAEKVEALTQWAMDKASGKTDAPAPESTEPVANAESGTNAGSGQRPLGELHGLASQPQGVTVSHNTKSLTYLTPDEQAAAEQKYQQAFGGMSDGQIAALVGAPDGAKVNISWNKFDKRFEAVAIAPGFSSHRYLKVGRDGKPKVENFRVVINKDSPLKGQGIKLFARQVDALAAAGQTEIETNAKGSQKDKTYFGYKVWPKVGYDGPIPNKFLRKMPKELSAPLGSSPKLSELLQSEAGRKWWDENGGDIDLKFDLREGSESRKTLANYLASKGQPKPDTGSAAAQPAPDATGTNAAPKTRLQALAEKAHAQGTPNDDVNTEYAKPRDQYAAFVRAVVPPTGTKPDSAKVLDYLSKLPGHARERLDEHFRGAGKSLREVEAYHRQAAGVTTAEQEQQRARAERAARADAGEAAIAAASGKTDTPAPAALPEAESGSAAGAGVDAKPGWQEAYNAAKSEHAEQMLEAMKRAWGRGESVVFPSSMRSRIFPPSAADNMRVRGGEVQMRVGKEWQTIPSGGGEYLRMARTLGAPKPPSIADYMPNEPIDERFAWQIPKSEWVNSDPDENNPDDHRWHVETALQGGETVAPEVLADYPDLAAKYAKPATGSSAAPKPPDVNALKKNPKADIEHLAALQKQHAEGSPEWESLDMARDNVSHADRRDNSVLSALHGGDAQHGKRHFVLERLASAAAASEPKGAKAATDAITSLGGQLDGPAPGATVPHDASKYDGPEGAFTGDAVKVVRQPVTYNGALVYRGKVEPVSGTTAATNVDTAPPAGDQSGKNPSSTLDSGRGASNNTPTPPTTGGQQGGGKMDAKVRKIRVPEVGAQFTVLNPDGGLMVVVHRGGRKYEQVGGSSRGLQEIPDIDRAVSERIESENLWRKLGVHPDQLSG